MKIENEIGTIYLDFHLNYFFLILHVALCIVFNTLLP